MSDIDLTKLTDAQLGALKMAGGDLTKLPDAMLMSLKESQSPKAEPGMVDKALDKVNTGVNWAGTQLTKGFNTLLGLPADVQGLGNAGAKMALEAVLGPGKAKQPMTNTMPGAADLNKAVFQGLGVPEVNAADNPALTLTKPFGLDAKINLGSMLDAGAQAIPSMLSGGPVTAIPGFFGGVGSDAAGQATAGTPYEIPARIAGGVAGYKLGQRGVTPLPSNLTPQQQQNVEVARELGIPMTVGQETGRGRRIESVVGRFPTSEGRMSSFSDQQRRAINQKALQTTGTAGDRVDPGTINSGFDRLGQEFSRLSQGRTIELRPDFYNRVGRSVADYTENTLPSDVSRAVTRRWNDIQSIPPAGGSPYPAITSEQYQEFRRSISTAAADATDPAVRRTLREMRTALDDAMESSLPAADAEAWRTARTQYGNLKTVSKAAASGTQDSRSAGDLSPGALTSAVRQSRGTDQFARGQTPLNDLARVADYLADTRPNSGTPERLAMQAAITGTPITAGYALGGVPGAVTAGVGMMAPNVVARAMTGTGGFGWLRDYLANQATRDQLGLKSVPFALLPGASNTPRLENRR